MSETNAKCPTCGSDDPAYCSPRTHARGGLFLCDDDWHFVSAPIAPPALPWLLGQPKRQSGPNPPWPAEPDAAGEDGAAIAAWRADPGNWNIDGAAFARGYAAGMEAAAKDTYIEGYRDGWADCDTANGKDPERAWSESESKRVNAIRKGGL